MSALKDTFDKVEGEITAQLQTLHLTAQIGRFLRIAAFAFVSSLPVSVPSGRIGWAALLSLGAGALEAAYRQVKPALPISEATGTVATAIKTQAMQLATGAIDSVISEAKTRGEQVAATLGLLKSAQSAPAPTGTVTVNVSGEVATDPKALTDMLAKGLATGGLAPASAAETEPDPGAAK